MIQRRKQTKIKEAVARQVQQCRGGREASCNSDHATKRKCSLDDSQDDWQKQKEFDRMTEEYEGTECIEQALDRRGKLAPLR